MTGIGIMVTHPQIFQLTSSRRGWQYAPEIVRTCPRYFNSHPHEEDDTALVSYGGSGNISTHILTKRMTYPACVNACDINISTHILTKRMTLQTGWVSENNRISTHILTKRMTMTGVKPVIYMSFQLTSSRRGWRYSQKYRRGQNVFQLTSSRRGWHNSSCFVRWLRKYFNSHPHEEDDNKHSSTWIIAFLFQLTSSRRGWRR